MSKKKPIMSLSLDQDVQDKINLAAKQQTKGNKSELIRRLVDKFLIIDEDVIPVLLKIPGSYKGSQENIKNWLDVKFAAIVKTLS